MPRKAAAELPHSKSIEFATGVVRARISFITKLFTPMSNGLDLRACYYNVGRVVYRLACAKDDAMRR